MIKKLLSAAAVLLFAGNIMAQEQPVNIVSNPGFEEWSEYKGKFTENRTPEIADKMIPTDWNVSMHSPEKAELVTGAVAKDATEKHSGEYSIKVTNSSITDATDVSRWNVTVKPSTRYRVSVWVKGKEVVLGKNKYGASIWASSGPKKGFWGNKKGGYKFSRLGGTFDWTQLYFEYTTRDVDEQVMINAQLRLSTGTVWFDDFEMVEVK